MSKAATKRAVMDASWLHYFNKVLYEQGITTESQRNKMALKIDGRTPPARQDNRARKAPG